MMQGRYRSNTHIRGSILLSLVAVILISFIGLSLLGHVVTHQRIAAARIQRNCHMEPVFQELVRHLHLIKEQTLQLDIRETANPQIEYFNCDQFPDRRIDGITISNHFSHTINHFATYDVITVSNRAESVSQSHPYQFAAGMEIAIMAGEIPLAYIPLYLKQKIEISPASFLEENDISIAGFNSAIIDDSPAAFDATAFLMDTLRIDGRMLDWMSVRRRLGFELKSEPIPDGIYFFEEDSRITAVFAQGDIQRLALYSHDDRQFVLFEQGGVEYLLAYCPGQRLFGCWDPSIPDETGFDEKIIVNGDCLALEQQGDIAFHQNSDLKLLVSGQTVIKSRLVSGSDQLDIQKAGWTHLTIISGAHGLSPSSGAEPTVIIENSQETRLELSLLINGKIINHSRKLILNGSMFATAIENNGSIYINHLFPRFNEDAYFLTKKATILHKILINYIEEATNGYN